MLSDRLYRLGRFCARRPWTVIGSWLVASVLVIGASGAFGSELEDSFEAPGVDSQRATELLVASGSDQAGLTAQLVVTPRDERATFFGSGAEPAALAELQAKAAALPRVLGTSDPAGALEAGSAVAVRRGAVSADGRVALIRMRYPVLEEVRADDLENLKALGVQAAAGSPLRLEMGGDLFFAFEEPETGTGELIGLVVAAVVLLVAFGSVIATGLPIAIALFGLALGISSMALIAHLVDIPSWVPELGSMVGLGVGIDYALFLITRHREHLAGGMPVEESVGRAVQTAGQVVVFAGGTVVIAILGLAVAGVPMMTAAGIAIAVIVLIMVVASITLLPAFLGLAGAWINRLGFVGIRARKRVPNDARWRRWGGHVSGHAWPYAVGVTILLLALTAPVLALQMGNPDEGALPETRTERRAYDLTAAAFGPGVNGPLVIAVDIADDRSVVGPLRDAIDADAGVASVASGEAAAGVATLVAIPTTGPQDDVTRDTLARLRSDVLPDVLGASPARAHIGGQTASFVDVSDRVTDRLPFFIAAVLVLSSALLVAIFRSILVPLKAALMNLLSIGASYGVLVMVFQWGWGAGLIGLESTVPIISFIPMFMFAIVFGLSMDYEVFLLSRMREEYLRSGDNAAAIIEAIAGTARVITSAALIMISVFLGFVLGDDPATKMFGLGLATAIFIDATIVRLVLVPAAMTILGDANWWMPRRLEHLLPAVDTDGRSGSPMLESRAEPIPEAGPTRPGPSRAVALNINDRA